MGTNYYFKTTNRDLVHTYFAKRFDYSDYEEYYDEEYKLLDVPDFHYVIHLNKLSYGWKPLFQIHKCFQTWDELKQFYHDHDNEGLQLLSQGL